MTFYCLRQQGSYFLKNFPTFLFFNRVIDVKTYDKRKEGYKNWKK